MSTNEDIIATNRELIDQYDPAFAHVLKVTTDALEQTTRELKDALSHAREDGKEHGRLEREIARQKSTLKKVRLYAEQVGGQPWSWADGHRRKILAILDESASRPECGEKHPVTGLTCGLPGGHEPGHVCDKPAAPAPIEASDGHTVVVTVESSECSGGDEVGVSWDEGLVLHEGDTDWHPWDESIYGARPGTVYEERKS